MVKRLLEVSNFVYTPSGDAYAEPKMDRKGRVMIEALDENGENIWKFPHQMEKSDTPVYEDKRIGQLITFALDKLDEKANGEDIRKRFALSCRVEAAMKDNKSLEVESKDLKLIEGTLEAIKNPMFNYRIQEALDSAEIIKESD